MNQRVSKERDVISSVHEEIMLVRFLELAKDTILKGKTSKRPKKLEALRNDIKVVLDECNPNKDHSEISLPLLSRYINRRVLPRKKERRNELMDYVMAKFSATELIAQKIETIFHENGNITINHSQLMSDYRYLQLICFLAHKKHPLLNEREYDRVVTVEVDGIPFALMMAQELDIPCLYLRRTRPAGVDKDNVFSKDLWGTRNGRVESLYLKKGILKKNNERILVVDDVIRSGTTQIVLNQLLRKAEVTVEGIIVLVGLFPEKIRLLFKKNEITWDKVLLLHEVYNKKR